jgi:hypothetical protein
MREITHDQFSRAILDGIDAAQAVSHKAFTTEEVIALQDHRYETDTTVIGSYSIVENDKRHDCPLRATGIATRNRPPYLHEHRDALLAFVSAFDRALGHKPGDAEVLLIV